MPEFNEEETIEELLLPDTGADRVKPGQLTEACKAGNLMQIKFLLNSGAGA